MAEYFMHQTVDDDRDDYYYDSSELVQSVVVYQYIVLCATSTNVPYWEHPLTPYLTN